jgi:hypothetical protein
MNTKGNKKDKRSQNKVVLCFRCVYFHLPDAGFISFKQHSESLFPFQQFKELIELWQNHDTGPAVCRHAGWVVI